MKEAFDAHAEFVMAFVAESGECRREFEEIWDEVETNYLVRSLRDSTYGQNTKYPFLTSSDPLRGKAILKDPETHQEVMTIVSKLILAAMGEPGFIKSRPVGFEDTFKAPVVSKLIEYDLSREGTFWQFVLWVVHASVYGTGVVEAYWDYEEQPRVFRNIQVDPYTGYPVSNVETLIVPVKDHPCVKTVNVRDFFPDHGGFTTGDMYGAAKRFTLTPDEAMSNPLYDREAVKRGVERASAASDKTRREGTGYEDETFGNELKSPPSIAKPIIGYEYVGTVPTKESDGERGLSEDDGIQRRVITVIGGETVRNDPWPRRLPFFDLKLTPRLDSFWGLGAAEVVKYDQDFADMLKMQLADAVVRMVHPSPIVNRNVGVDVAKLRNPSPDRPIFANTTQDAIEYLKYDPNVQAAFAMQSNVKGQMREATGALGAIQGLGLGTKRFSASEATASFQQALDRPELFAQVLERVFLPPLGKYLLSLNQEYLETDDDLRQRIGESNTTVFLADILADFDVQFVGSRQTQTKTEMLSAFRELFSQGANPVAAQLIPWVPLLKEYIEKGLGLGEIAAMVGNPEMVQMHLALNTLAGPNKLAGNGNGTTPSLPPAGQQQAQGFGDEQIV